MNAHNEKTLACDLNLSKVYDMTERRYCKKCEFETLHEKFELGRRKIQEFQSIRMDFHSVNDGATFWVACTRCRLQRNRSYFPTITDPDPQVLEIQAEK